MKTTQAIIIVLIQILITNCSTKKINSIEGLWCHCGYSGDYEEFLFVNSLAFHTIIFKKDVDEGSPIDLDFFSRLLGPFRYNGDSIRIVMGDEVYDENSPYLFKKHINFITRDQIELSPRYDQRMQKVIFNRVHDYPKPPLNILKRNNEWWAEFKNNLEERMKIKHCPDLRTKDEKLQDSIDEINNSVILSEQSEDFEDLIDIDSYLKSEKDSIK